MMSTRRSFFTFGALVAAVALLAPAAAQAQLADLAIMPTDPARYDALDLSWTIDDAAATTGYRIYLREQGDTPNDPSLGNHDNAMDVTGRTTDDVTFTGLKPNTKYRAAIVEMTEDGVVEASIIQSSANSTATLQEATTAMAGAPAPPRNVRAMGGDGTFTVMWDAPYAGESGLMIKEYRVQKREVSGNLFGDWVPDEGDDEGGKMVDGDTTMIMFEGLDNGITYQARVMATNTADVEGPYSVLDNDMSDPGDEAATTGEGDGMTETPALPLVGILLLGAGLVAAGRRRLRQ
ncbi:MAG: fibronectin type III domain-containing protein [Acidobacteria bacterium]|nr:fibronectin type III domain-containing protein [Acidobacteriota bacterium]